VRKSAGLILSGALVLAEGCRIDYDPLPASEGVVVDGSIDAGGAGGSILGEAGASDGGVFVAGSGGASAADGSMGGTTSDTGTEGGSGTTDGATSAGGANTTSSGGSTTSSGGSTTSTGGANTSTGAATTGVDDATCDGIDDDDDGQVDEDYVESASACGMGVCQAAGALQCVSGEEIDDCVPGSPNSTEDGPLANGLDDDCDGEVDEDFVACDTAPRSFLAGEHLALEVPVNCTQVTVRLWGGAGAGGDLEGVLFQPGGRGGAGGYAETAFAVSGTLDLYVGSGASAGCNLAGGVTGPVMASGGTGNSGAGADGGDGLVIGGGSGARPSSASRGGDGYYGGGGGGAGDPVIGLSGRAGGGGAASYVLSGGTLVALAGGGGGGGGAASILLVLGVPGGDGGQGCGGDGDVADISGGGGGGGGVCIGTTTQQGTSGTPFDAASLPAGQATGGTSSCNAGGDGYAIVAFST